MNDWSLSVDEVESEKLWTPTAGVGGPHFQGSNSRNPTSFPWSSSKKDPHDSGRGKEEPHWKYAYSAVRTTVLSRRLHQNLSPAGEGPSFYTSMFSLLPPWHRPCDGHSSDGAPLKDLSFK